MMAAFGALPDNTGEFALGDVLVTIVLFESDSTLAPFDNGTVTVPGFPNPVSYTPENWTPAAISAAIQKVRDGANWWKSALDALPNVADGLLNFQFDLTYANTPVRTGYEPIARNTNDFALWVYDFLEPLNFNSGDFAKDIRAFNNYQRLKNDTDWAFTVFVVNDANDGDGRFALGSPYAGGAFAYPGGQFVLSPAGRPTSTFAHEIGHIFWAFDEYSGGPSYDSRRGYYNSQNTNAVTGNPAASEPGYQQQPSLMAGAGPLRDLSFNSLELPEGTRALIGWRDSDGDGIFDVLDVPFSLEGSGSYSPATGKYKFTGTSTVRTLPNQNSSTITPQSDMTINKIRRVEYSINNGAWVTAATYNAHSTNINIEFSAPAGDNTIRIRTFDTRTGVASDLFVGNTSQPTQQNQGGGISGFAYRDDNSNGVWDAGEQPLVDLGVEVLDANGNPIALQKRVEPNDYAPGTTLAAVVPGATLTAFGVDVSGPVQSVVSASAPSAGRVFGAARILSGAIDRWTESSRNLRIVFNEAVSTFTLRALAGTNNSFARIEVYNSANQLLERYTTAALTSSQGETIIIERSQADIAYVVARAFAGSEVVFDTLTWGPQGAATTNAQGAYHLPGLPAGTYTVQVTAPPNYTPANPATGRQTLALAASGAVNVNFGFAFLGNPWHNIGRPEDVNGDTFVTGLDAILIVNWLISAGPSTSPLPTVKPSGFPFLDVNNDNYITGLDAIVVVNYLNIHTGGDGEGAFAPPSGGAPLSGGEGEGEATLSEEAAAAASYFASRPSDFSGSLTNNPHTSACGCCNCTIEQIAPAVASAPSQTPLFPAEEIYGPQLADTPSSIRSLLDLVALTDRRRRQQ